MINIVDMQFSFVVKWFKLIYSNTSALFSQIPLSMLEFLGSDFSVLKCNVSSKEFKGLG